MAIETRLPQDSSRKWQWLIIPLVVAVSFSCVFLSAQGAIMGDTERVINANMVSDSRVSYHIDPGNQVHFAPLNSIVILEASVDADSLKITPAAPTESGTGLNLIPPHNSPTPGPTNHQTNNLPIKTERAKPTSHPPSDNPFKPSATNITPTQTLLHRTSIPTKTNTAIPTKLPTNTPTATPTATSTAPENLVPPTQTPSQTPTNSPPKPTNEPKPTKEPKPSKEPKPTKEPKPPKKP